MAKLSTEAFSSNFSTPKAPLPPKIPVFQEKLPQWPKGDGGEYLLFQLKVPAEGAMTTEIYGGCGGDGGFGDKDRDAAGIRAIPIGADHEVHDAVAIHICRSQGITKIPGSRPRDDDIRQARPTGIGIVIVKDIGAAGTGGVLIGTDGEVSAAIGIEVARGEGRAEGITGGFTRDGHISGSGGGGDGAVIVKDIGAAGIGGVALGTDRQIRPAIGIEVA